MSANNPGPLGTTASVTTVAPTDLVENTSGPPPVDSPDRMGDATPLYPEGRPAPRGLQSQATQPPGPGENADPIGEVGVEGEVVVWEATYSLRNFIGRTIVRSLLTIAWVALAVNTWGMGHENHASLTWAAGAVVGLLWLALVFRMFRARYSHFYRLTNRRLFVSTGLVNRRRDMMELLTVKDVFTRQQNLLERWIGLGTVVVVPGEKDIPTFYLAGVDDPKEVMDLVWHQARTERDRRTIKVDSV